jgi:flagellar biosynthesis component FlhA
LPELNKQEGAMKEPINKKFVCEECGATFSYGLLLRKHYRKTGHGSAEIEPVEVSTPSENPEQTPTPPNELEFDSALSELTKNLQWEKMLTDGGTSREVLSLTLKAEERHDFMRTLKTVARDFALETGVLLPSIAMLDGERRILTWGDRKLGELRTSKSEELLGLLKDNCSRFLSIRQVEARLKNLWADRPELYRAFEEVGLSVSRTVRVLRELLTEGASLRNFAAVMECVILVRSQYSTQTDLVDVVRSELGLARADEPPKKIIPEEVAIADCITVVVGRALTDLVDPRCGAPLCERVGGIRASIAREFGWILPGVRFKDDLSIEPNGFRILIRDEEYFRGEVKPKLWLAIGPESKLSTVRGVRTTDPVYGMPAVWILPEQRGECERIGCMLFTAESVISMALTNTVKAQASSLFTYGYFMEGLLPNLCKTEPALVRVFEASPKLALNAKMVFCRLLEEGVSVKNQVTILETLMESEELGLSVEVLTEMVRKRLGGAVCFPYQMEPGRLGCLLLSDEIEALCLAGLDKENYALRPDSHQERKLRHSIGIAVEELREQHAVPEVLVTVGELRRPLKDFFHQVIPDLVVISEDEIPCSVDLVCLGEVEARFTKPPTVRRPYPPGCRNKTRLKKFRKRRL